MKALRFLPPLCLAAAPAFAGEPAVIDARAARAGDGWRFDVTLAHDDEGWDHYADAWEVRTAAGETLGTRRLLHPHVDEQPFTRSLSGVRIPEGTAAVAIFAHDSVHGWSPEPFLLDLTE